MPEGFTIDDGWVSESSIHDLASWYHTSYPQTSERTFEAHLMVMRAYANLLPGSPLDPSGGLSRARYNVLRLLYRAPEQRLLMGDFAEEMSVSPTNVTKLMDTLVSDGLVVRETHEVDKRKTWAKITQLGIELVEKSIPAVGDHVKGLWEGLDEDEKRALIHLLAKMRMHAVASGGAAASTFLRDLAPTP